MKRILLLAIVGINSFVGSNFLEAKSIKDVASSISVNDTIIPQKGIVHADSLPKRQMAKFEVDYIIDENEKNYVIFIKSDHPDFHHKIIQMVRQIPVDSSKKDRINKLVFEYEL